MDTVAQANIFPVRILDKLFQDQSNSLPVVQYYREQLMPSRKHENCRDQAETQPGASWIQYSVILCKKAGQVTHTWTKTCYEFSLVQFSEEIQPKNVNSVSKSEKPASSEFE